MRIQWWDRASAIYGVTDGVEAVMRSSRLSFISGAIALNFFAGCAGSESVFKPFDPSSAEIEREVPQYQVEVETIEEQALNAVQASPVDFTVDFSKNSEVWERSKLFFLQYTKGAAKGEVRNSGIYLTNENSRDRFLYTITQSPGSNGMSYSVKCAERGRGDTDDAAINARNAARFIRDGKLELKLLRR